MALALHCTLFAADGKSIAWEGVAAGHPGKQQDFRLCVPASDVRGDTRAVFRTVDGTTVSLAG